MAQSCDCEDSGRRGRSSRLVDAATALGSPTAPAAAGTTGGAWACRRRPRFRPSLARPPLPADRHSARANAQPARVEGPIASPQPVQRQSRAATGPARRRRCRSERGAHLQLLVSGEFRLRLRLEQLAGAVDRGRRRDRRRRGGLPLQRQGRQRPVPAAGRRRQRPGPARRRQLHRDPAGRLPDALRQHWRPDPVRKRRRRPVDAQLFRRPRGGGRRPVLSPNHLGVRRERQDPARRGFVQPHHQLHGGRLRGPGDDDHSGALPDPDALRRQPPTHRLHRPGGQSHLLHV